MLFKNRKVEVRFLKDTATPSDPHIREIPKEVVEMATDVNTDRVVKGGKVLIQTYFAWKMADRVLEKLLR